MEVLLICAIIISVFFLISRVSKFFIIPKSSLNYYTTVSLILSKYEYFTKLNSEQKQQFAEIIRIFNKHIKYYGNNGLTITKEIKIIIGAGFAKLCLGNDFRRLYSFNSILVFPKAYKNVDRKTKYLGKTSIKGFISISWEDILKSEADLHDGVNLALHEFAHALVVEMMQFQAEFEIEYFMVRQIYYTGKKEIEAVENGKEPIFRKYAYSSPHEFFAVAVEIFFELPEKLIKHHWKTYRNFCVLFRQNPLNNEIGKINLKSILDFPHEPGLFNNIEHTCYYGPFTFTNFEVKIEINNIESKFKVSNSYSDVETIKILHSEVLYAAIKNIAPTGYTNPSFHFVIYFIRNNIVDTVRFTSSENEQINEMVDIYRKIGLAI